MNGPSMRRDKGDWREPKRELHRLGSSESRSSDWRRIVVISTSSSTLRYTTSLPVQRDRANLISQKSNLPTYRSTTYRAVSRSYTEFLKLVEALAANNPQTIIPALPLSQTSAMTEEEDDRMIKASFQRWFGRILGDGVVVKDEELRGFIENDFGVCPAFLNRRAI